MQRSFSETDPTNKEVEVEETRTTSHPQLITSMDGNVELSAPMVMVPTTISGGANRIKINISKPLPVITPKEVNSENSDSNAVIRPKELPPIEDLEPLSYKPALQNVPLKKLPPVKKGSELTGLCSIMWNDFELNKGHIVTGFRVRFSICKDNFTCPAWIWEFNYLLRKSTRFLYKLLLK